MHVVSIFRSNVADDLPPAPPHKTVLGIGSALVLVFDQGDLSADVLQVAVDATPIVRMRGAIALDAMALLIIEK